MAELNISERQAGDVTILDMDGKVTIGKNKPHVQKLFEERQKFYCLADWHFIVRPELNSFELAKKIAEEVFL